MSLNFPLLLASANVRAFLEVIAEGEVGRHDEEAYRVIVGGGRFDSFADHPRVKVYIPRLNVTSSAAGKFQFLASTWDDVAKRYGLDSFSPFNQDCGAVGLINDRGAVDDVIAGRLEVAIAKCSPIWASLPGDVYGQGGITMQRARAVFLAYGGAENVAEYVAPSPAAEPASGPSTPVSEEKPSMAPALLIGLLSSLAEIFTPILRSRLSKVLDRATGDSAISGQVADTVIGLARQAAAQALPGVVAPPPGAAGTPAPAAPVDPVVAVGMVKASPTLAAQVEAQVAAYLDQIAPLLEQLDKMEQAAWKASEDSANAAAARYAARPPDGWDMTQTLVWGMLVMMAFLLLFVAGIAGWQTYVNNAPSTEVWAAVTGLIGFATGIAVTVFAFRFGYSRQSGAKDALLSELATARRI